MKWNWKDLNPGLLASRSANHYTIRDNFRKILVLTLWYLTPWTCITMILYTDSYVDVLQVFILLFTAKQYVVQKWKVTCSLARTELEDRTDHSLFSCIGPFFFLMSCQRKKATIITFWPLPQYTPLQCTGTLNATRSCNPLLEAQV